MSSVRSRQRTIPMDDDPWIPIQLHSTLLYNTAHSLACSYSLSYRMHSPIQSNPSFQHILTMHTPEWYFLIMDHAACWTVCFCTCPLMQCADFPLFSLLLFFFSLWTTKETINKLFSKRRISFLLVQTKKARRKFLKMDRKGQVQGDKVHR